MQIGPPSLNDHLLQSSASGDMLLKQRREPHLTTSWLSPGSFLRNFTRWKISDWAQRSFSVACVHPRRPSVGDSATSRSCGLEKSNFAFTFPTLVVTAGTEFWHLNLWLPEIVSRWFVARKTFRPCRNWFSYCKMTYSWPYIYTLLIQPNTNRLGEHK